ncbi:Kinesin, motor domain-containing protein [Artemisia annua]|uniref:Kinesin-like protein KIN-10A n=1 Tax=Artemisia annua TaxID=35608 RepID=A0A2U1PIN9_ARTAN|nr:Kinesin, motor domain-containing protein [Artemisia annua]
MAPPPFTTPKSNHNNQTTTTTPSSCKSNNPKTPLSKHRLNFSKPSPNPNSTQPSSLDHPVEVIGRIRDYPDRNDNKPISSILHAVDSHSIRVRTDIGYRDFTLDGVSVSQDQDLDGFYSDFVQSRINGVKLGDKCTIMMYGPTGSGKSHTMFGCASNKQQGIVYKSLRDILGDEDQKGVGFVQVTVLEIYNEEIYDLLSTNSANAGFGVGWSRGNSSKVKLEVMGKKAKNATFISGTEAGKISKEIQKVEKRRIVKSTFCNERSSRSHCMIILDVPTVGGRLMLVDMAGSENIEQAGQTGFEAKMQTAKINQGNIALKRVVESIANGDSHVPFRDSKLTMLLQDSFEDDKSKILMILCASPDPKEMHKTISTLEYGAKAKCIVKLEVMGKKAKNATFISGTEAGKISKEIQKVEKRRIVKSTFCNERSSRSHCMIILDVPTVGGRLMLVDMAGSENIEQAGQTGFEAKMQTAKINQGNIALKRVVESIANGDSHVPFRDSKLTMLLQDSFEDDKSKILMILCASPDPKEMHKTISTLEYGAKAKCIVRGPHTPIKADDSSSDVVLGSRIAAMDQFICKLQMENKIREKEKNEAHKQLMKKEEEIAGLRAKLAEAEEKKSEEEINMKVNERTNMLKRELEKKIEECQKMADQVVEMERRKMEEKILQQQAEVEMLRRRLEEIESELSRSRDGKENENRNMIVSSSMEGNSFAKKLMDIYADEDPGMEKSMDLDKSLDMDVGGKHKINTSSSSIQAILGYPFMDNLQNDEYEGDAYVPTKAVLSTNPSSAFNLDIDSIAAAATSDDSECMGQDTASSRHLRIQNIFTLCGNYRELSHHTPTPLPTTNNNMTDESPVRPTGEDKLEIKQSLTDNMRQVVCDSKENCSPTLSNSSNDKKSDVVEVVVKWEAASVQNGGGVITTLRLVKDSTLADLRKLIEIYLAADNQDFTFLALGGDPTGAPVAKDDEASVVATKLPTCNNSQTRRQHLACLRPSKKLNSSHIPLENKLPYSSLENKLPFASLEKKLPFSSIENMVPVSADSVIGSPLF